MKGTAAQAETQVKVKGTAAQTGEGDSSKGEGDSSTGTKVKGTAAQTHR